MQLTISPGEEVFLRLDVNDVRKTQLHQILPNDIIALEQTRPPVDNTHLNKIILLTFKTPGEKVSRSGFEARIQEIAADYRIILHKLNDPAPCDLRIWPRIRLDLIPDIRAYCQDKEIQVVDISGGGAHIVLNMDDCRSAISGTIVKMKFIFEKGEVVVDAEILRTWKDNSQKDHVAVKFCGSHNISHYIY